MLTFTSSTPPVSVKATISGLRIAKAHVSYSRGQRARDAADWVRGEVAVAPTVGLAARVFGVSVPAVKEQLEWCKHRAANGHGAVLSDDAVDRIVSAIGADRVLAAVDRATQPQLPLAAVE